MKLPKAEPATAQETAEMLAVQRAADPRTPLVQALDPDKRLEHLEELTARTAEAEVLDSLYMEPLPPGYVVIFTIDDQRRTIYSLRAPAGATHGVRLCAVDMRVVLADAWDHYFTRWPDGVTPQMLEQLIEEPSAPACHVRRTLWELALHHIEVARFGGPPNHKREWESKWPRRNDSGGGSRQSTMRRSSSSSERAARASARSPVS